jgi:hypothetical protein
MEDIDFHDARYKISRNRVPDKLINSVLTWGLLEDPVLLPAGERYIVLIGHNRLSILKNAGKDDVTSRVTPEFNLDAFINAAALKFQRGDIGPLGRIKFLMIAREHSPGRTGEILQLAGREFSMPDFICQDNDIMRQVLELPSELCDYIDSRDIGYKTLKELVLLPENAKGTLTSWIKCINFRMNIFREIVEILADLLKRDGSLLHVHSINLMETEDPRGRENHLLGVLKELRCPEYTKRKQRAEGLMSLLSGKGAVVDFPPYFEGENVGIGFRVNKREGVAGLRKKLDQLDMRTVQDLLDLL